MVLKRSSSSAGWKKIELHGTQTVVWSAANRVAIWKEIELQGSQTSY